MSDEREPAQGWTYCEGAGELGVVVNAKWLRCPACHWVGFPTRMSQVKPIPSHQRPTIGGQLSLLE